MYNADNTIAVVTGSDIDCTVDCACCLDGECGQGNWFHNECTKGCIDGYVGARCMVKCPQNCKTCTSEGVNMYCSICHEGYYTSAWECTSCLPNCKTCTSSTSCNSCKEEYYNDNGSNDCRYYRCPENCKCVNNQCASCKDGYYNTSNSCKSSCPGNCVICPSSTNCDSCKDDFYNGYQYDDSSTPLLNNCTYKCRDYCSQCSSYNQCSVCNQGQYGLTCEKTCSVGCSTGICDIQNGSCTCSANFDGDKCAECQTGKYGDMCDKQCSTGCKGNRCHRTDGTCRHGCVDGFHGFWCSKKCSSDCIDTICNQNDGKCIKGCKSNVMNESICSLVSGNVILFISTGITSTKINHEYYIVVLTIIC